MYLIGISVHLFAIRTRVSDALSFGRSANSGFLQVGEKFADHFVKRAKSCAKTVLHSTPYSDIDRHVCKDARPGTCRAIRIRESPQRGREAECKADVPHCCRPGLWLPAGYSDRDG